MGSEPTPRPVWLPACIYHASVATNERDRNEMLTIKISTLRGFSVLLYFSITHRNPGGV